MADNYTLKNGFTTIQRGDGAVWIDRTKGVEDVDPGWYMKGGVRAPDTDTAPAPPTPPAGSGVQGTGIPAGMTKYTLKNNIDTFQRGDGAVWIDHTKGVPDAQPGWYFKGGHRAPDTDTAPPTPNQGVMQAAQAAGMNLQGASQGPSSAYTPTQIPAGALSSNPIADWALRKAAATRAGRAVADVAQQAALSPGRVVGGIASDLAGLGYLASAQAKAHPILGRALRIATQMTPEQMQQGAQTIQEYERPFLETELQPTTTAGEWTKKGGELAGMAGEAALLGPAAAAAYGLQGAGARATAIQGKATPNQMLAEAGLSGLTNFALAQFMPAGKLPTPQAGALWQFAKDLAMQGSKGAAAGAAMGVGENLISKIHDPNAPVFTKDVGQNALQFAGFEMGHTLLKLPVYQDIASQRRAVLDHPEGPAGVSADATRMIDAVNAAKDNGLVDPESAQGHIDTLTRMKDLADRIAQTRAGKKAQAAADKAKATAEQAAAPAAETAPAKPTAPTPEPSATSTELPTFGEDSIKAARLSDLVPMYEARGLEMPTGMGREELKKYLLKDQETRSPKPPEEVPSATQEGQVEEGHPGEHPGGDQVSEGEGIVRQPEGAGQEAAPVNRSGGIQEGGEVPESVIPEEVKEANREDHEARLLQQIRPELQERFTTDLNNAKDILDNRADTVISRLTPIDAQLERIERAFARREAKGRIPSAEEALDQNADYQRLLKERESILSDGHAAIENIHDSSAILADRYGLDKQDIRRAIMGLGSEDEGTSPTRTEAGAEAGAEQRIPAAAGEPEGGAPEAGLPEHADEAGVQGGKPGAEGGAGVSEAGAEAHRGAEAPEAPEAEGRAIGAAPEGTAGEGNVGAEGEAGEGGKAPDYSRPANAAKRERIAADNLGLQGLYEKGFDLVKKQLNLPEGATEMDLVHEVGNRIGKLGASVMDTARKIMATFKGIGKDMAQSLANLLHELNPFQGREGELGAVGEKRPHEQEIHDAINEMYPGEENKALRRLIYQHGGILSAKTKELGMLRVGEFLKGASFDENGNFKVLSPKERAARVAAGIPAPIFDPTKVTKPEDAPKQLAPFMKDVADLGVQANEKGVYPVGHVPTDMNANNVKLRGKDLNWLERAAAWFVPRSHILTGTMRWGKGVMSLREIPETDKLLQTIHSLDVQQKNYGAFIKKMDELGIDNHSKEIQDRLRPFRDALGEAQAEYERARMNRKGNTDALADPKFKATEKQAWFKVLAAHETVEDEMMKLARDKKFSDARVAMLADQFDDPPDELLKLASSQEMKAAGFIKDMMVEYRDGAEAAGLPILKDSYFIHQVRAGLSDGVWKKMQEAGVKGLGLMENWRDLKIDPNAEDVRFAHRQPGGQLTLPDLYGGMGAYIEKATNLITKRQIVNKWTQAARLMDDAGYKNLANFINKDMEGYIKGYADQHYEWMDNMTRAWQMKQTALKVATAAKHTAKMPNSIVESGILNNMEAVKLLMGWDSLPKEVGDPLRQMVKTMVDASHFSRLEVGTGDVKADFARGALDKIIASGHQPVQFIEGAERGVNFAAALIDGYKRGLSPVDAMREAAGRSLLTNFSGVDQPLYARGSVGQAVGVFQGTVNKIMWLNVKRSGDIVKGLAGLMRGRELDAEEKRGLVVGLKAAAMMGTVTALSKKLDIPYDEWMHEYPKVYNILLHPLKVAASSIWNAAADKDHKWNVPEADWKREIMNFQLAPIVTQTLDDYDKYGYMTAAEKLVTPAAASDWFQAKSPKTALRYGQPGLERGVRQVTGAFKPSVKEEQEEAAGEKKEARQAAAAKKWGESWGRPGR